MGFAGHWIWVGAVGGVSGGGDDVLGVVCCVYAGVEMMVGRL